MFCVDLKDLALSVTIDLEHKFDLSIQLDKLDLAFEIAKEVDREEKWKIVGDSALKNWNVKELKVNSFRAYSISLLQ